jgi:ferredoxin
MSVNVKVAAKTKLKEGKPVLKAIRDLDMPINDSCDGKGKCGKCLITVKAGKVNEPTKEEIKCLGQEKLDKGLRLACMVVPEDEDVTVELVIK